MNWAHYIIQINIYLVVFYCFYRLLLDKETYFTLNRIYLIGSGFLSLALPFLKFEWFANQPVAQPVYQGAAQLNELVMTVTLAPQSPNQFNLTTLLVIIYFFGVTVFTCRFIYQLYGVQLLMKEGQKGVAFSFLRKQFVDERLHGSETISRHEQTHTRQLHSADVLFFEALGILIWFNPIIYFYKITIKRIHEYLADEEAARFQGDKDQYAMLLMSNVLGVAPNELTNGFFNQKILKKRIFMLYKQRSRKVAILKYGLFVPLFSIALAASSASIRNNEEIQQFANEIELEKQVEIVQDAVHTAISLPVTSKTKIKRSEDDKSAINYSVENPDWEMFYNFVRRSIRYPLSARNANVQGTSVVKFTIANGEVADAGVIATLGSGCDTEVLRTLLAYGDFKSLGDGKYILPVSFTIEGLTSTKNTSPTVKRAGYTLLNTVAVVGLPAQAISGETVNLSEVNVKADGSGKVYDFVSLQSQPTFPGGMDKFYQYVLNTIQYPEEAKDKKVTGKVFLSFVIETDGELSDIKIDRTLGYGTDEEALRVLKASPKWIPGIQDGQKVRVKYNIPISFSLTSTTATESNGAIVPDADGTGVTDGRLWSLEEKLGLKSPTSPLYIIDGVKQKPSKKLNSPLSKMDQENIASIEILADKVASELYGDEGKNGVILIVTTKKTPKKKGQ
jgi:TonB family protein